MSQKNPCQKHACAIQKCLQAHRYTESFCEAVIEEMRRCCKAHNWLGVSCSGFARAGTELKDALQQVLHVFAENKKNATWHLR